MKKNLLEQIRAGAALTGLEEVRLIAALSMPAVFAQISTVIMQYADQSMVGQLGAESSAAIGWFLRRHGWWAVCARRRTPALRYRWPTVQGREKKKKREVLCVTDCWRYLFLAAFCP